MSKRAVACLSALAMLAVPALGFAQMTGMQHPADSADNPADREFLGAMRDMMMGMHQSMPTGDTDQDFVRMMLPHHGAAVAMAKTELRYGSDPELKALATEIVTSQDKEMAMMKAWLDKHAK